MAVKVAIAGIMLKQKSCIFMQSASQKMHFWICNISLGCKYRNLLSFLEIGLQMVAGDEYMYHKLKIGCTSTTEKNSCT